MEEFTANTVQKIGSGDRRDLVHIRAWTPGDGISCAWACKPKSTPCGPPVAVTLTEVRECCWRDRCNDRCRPKIRAKRRVVCRNHIPGLYDSWQINLEARKAATERLVVQHWDEYQRYVEDETAARRQEAFEFADPEIRRIVLEACDADDNPGADN
ncbi:hypothetical protein [Streptomyces qinglanensis]|uniref:Uncharacterized protein n=1 Tax=Streptomyces qinglanensis TaxID=943816 RepID=A0A1H9U265_9ACTN|nr:hypothetical protein [Streptomyces qinglanensis]SES03585.1 hypothetical protein SAMN05421870_107250 [Streptomyces qinglanensis]